MGNILARYGVGRYVYDSTQPNAVDSIRDPLNSATTLHSYTYNANGSMMSRAGKTIIWTPFNKPYQVKNGTTVLSEFRYGFDRERIRQDTPAADIYYFGGVEWSWNADSTSDTEARIYLNAPSGRVGVHLKDASLAPSETRYFHTDHLGSIELVTNHLGEVIDRLSYSPWGQRRQDVWTHGNSFHKGVERRGFTGHEHLAYADFELIHMNGRVYDPFLARFVSADPFADGLAASQSLNRYAYVGNNPVSLTDPSGHFIGLILGFAFSHLTTSITAKVVLGAVIGGLQAAISGGDWGDVLQGAALGGVAAGIAHGIGEHFGHNPSVFDFGNEFGRALAHGLSQGGLHDVAGGSFGDGFLGGFFGSVGSSLMSSPGFGNTFDTRSSRLFAAVVIGGTASELGGGKFGNGALSAAFVEMFNHQNQSEEEDVEKHYSRNAENEKFLKDEGLYGKSDLTIEDVQKAGDYGMKQATDAETKYHRIGKGNENNIKFTSKAAEKESWWQRIFSNRYGRHEIILKPNVDGTYTHVKDPVNMGTLNRGNNPISHYSRDVVPYKKYGNIPSDKE